MSLRVIVFLNMSSAFVRKNQADALRKANGEEVPDSQLNNPFLYEKAQKKRFDYNHHMNSEEFKDLGTLHLERR